jgi:pyruvate/2-oxoglutarate dehydrogenase complex dihydrolipoamide dehydrogenase (E3) component
MKEYDIAVIGAGSAGLVAALTANRRGTRVAMMGGLVAALTAHRRGARVAMIEKDKIGGECTHSGCVPSKSLINVAKTWQATKHTQALGLPSVQATTSLDFGTVMDYVDSIVQGVYAHEKPEVFQDMGIDVFIHPSGAQFLNNRELQVGDEVLHAEHTILCTGSSPRMLPDVGEARLDILHNENFWSLREQPASVTFLGGGVISAELGQVLARFGTEVTIVDRNPRILKAVDEEVAAVAIEALERDGIRILANANCTACAARQDGTNVVHFEREGEQRSFETGGTLFASMGRAPNVAGLQLERAGIQYDERHGVQTNKYMQTTAQNVYACGDVTARLKFTHMASYQAEICIDNILKGNHRVHDPSAFPWAIFMDPEVGHVGMSEAQAREIDDHVQVSRVDTSSIDRFITESKTTGFLKVVMDENDVVLGADAVGAHAGEWVQLITVAIVNKLPITGFSDTIFAYPTFSEIVKRPLPDSCAPSGDRKRDAAASSDADCRKPR